MNLPRSRPQIIYYSPQNHIIYDAEIISRF